MLGIDDVKVLRIVSALLVMAMAGIGPQALAQTPPGAAASPVQPPPAAAPAQAPAAPALEPRTVRPRDITVITGSRFRIGNERYQIFGIRTPRPRAGQCLMERLRGRRARSTLRRILSRGEIRIVPTGQTNAIGDKLVRVSVDGQGVRRKLIDARVARPRRANETYNPWCISLRRSKG